MNLPYGVSGFYNSDEAKPPEMDVRKYKELCHGLGQKLNGELLEFADSMYAANFYKADFRFPALNICLVMNRHYPIIAFATSVEDMKIEFIDFPEGAEAVPEDFTVLPAVSLEAPLSVALKDLSDTGLNKGEIKQIKYWKPESIGQVVFNFWD